MSDIPERDWKYLRSIFGELIEELSRHSNDDIRGVLAQTDLSENEKRRKVYALVHQHDEIVAECFDDWRRSRAYERCRSLIAHRLLKPEHIANLSEESQQHLKSL